MDFGNIIKINKLQMAEMNTNTAELLQQMIDIKRDMRTAIGNKGVTVVSGMESYSSAIDSIQQEITVPDGYIVPAGVKFGCSDFVTLPSNLIFNEIEDMSYMFYNCSELTTIPYFDTSKVTDMKYMFYNCRKLTTIPQFDTSKVTMFSSTFKYCSSLVTIPLLDMSSRHFEVGSDTFYGCSELTNLGGFKNVMSNMDFSDSPKLTYQSLLNVINNLGWYFNVGSSPRLILGPTNLAKLTDDDIATATERGWEVIG